MSLWKLVLDFIRKNIYDLYDINRYVFQLRLSKHIEDMKIQYKVATVILKYWPPVGWIYPLAKDQRGHRSYQSWGEHRKELLANGSYPSILLYPI